MARLVVLEDLVVLVFCAGFLTEDLRAEDLVVVFREAEETAFLAARVERPSIDLFAVIIYNYSIMAIKITKKQLAVLDFIQDFTEERGISPTYREIQTGLNLSSVSAVAEHIDNLVAKGALKKVSGTARSLQVLDYRHEETVELFRVRMNECSKGEREVLERAAEILGVEV